MEQELGLTPSQFSLALGVFFIGYVLCEVPSNLLLKRFKPSRWIARIIVSWGSVSAASAFVSGFKGLVACRVLLGIAEAGFFPGIIYYLTFWYKKNEQALRTALFLSSGILAGAWMYSFSLFLMPIVVLAFVISKMDGFLGMSGWRWILLFEGVPSIVCGIVCWSFLPDFPSTARFLNPNEKRVATKRLQFDGNHETADQSSFNFNECLATMKHPRTWLFCIVYFLLMTPIYSFSFFMPTLVSNLGLHNVSAQLLSSPPYILTYCATISWAFHSDKHQDRKWHILIPFLLTGLGYTLLLLVTSTPAKYVIMTLTLVSAFCTSPPCLAWHNSTIQRHSSTVKATSTAMMISIGNLSGIVAPFLYSGTVTQLDESAGTQETKGHATNAVFCFVGSYLVMVLFRYLKRIQRDVLDDSMDDYLINVPLQDRSSSEDD